MFDKNGKIDELINKVEQRMGEIDISDYKSILNTKAPFSW